ncbi:uncharacterized protein LOC111016092 [Momordica charantia]|uniref:Uncharacterized protein LOC111016092 n=1 Tax=Momordica charantia TaxID=3673 RepID=A0A6J1CZX7_MOMCH|nr:uncharacterized protein LOC111016092 [Momordica charantia]
MEFRSSYIFFSLLIILPLARCEDTGTVLFVDSSSHQYLRSHSPDDGFELSSMSLPEIGAAISVLLGFVPPSTLSASGSSKLNGILMPNPLDRPRAVLMLEIKGEYGPEIVNLKSGISSNVLTSKVHVGSESADIQLPDEDEVSVVPLNEPLTDYTDEDIREFASFIGGSYIADESKTLNGELTVPLTDAIKINLYLSKIEDREFIGNLLCLFHNSRRAVHIHEDLSQNVRSPAELISGSFNSIKALKDQDDSEGDADHRSRLFIVTLSKIFHLLQEAYDGQIVGVILFSESSPQKAEKGLNVVFTPRLAPRWLVEDVKLNTTIQEVILVRTTLAWITGIILLIATLMGSCCLLRMPLTRDTLLYSNVKLD